MEEKNRILPKARGSVIRWATTYNGLITHGIALLDWSPDDDNLETIWYLATGKTFTNDEMVIRLGLIEWEELLPAKNLNMLAFQTHIETLKAAGRSEEANRLEKEKKLDEEFKEKALALSIDYLRDIKQPTMEIIERIRNYDQSHPRKKS